MYIEQHEQFTKPSLGNFSKHLVTCQEHDSLAAGKEDMLPDHQIMFN